MFTILPLFFKHVLQQPQNEWKKKPRTWKYGPWICNYANQYPYSGASFETILLFDFCTISKILTLRARTVLKFLKKYRQFCCTGLLCSKLIHLDDIKLASFTSNLLQNLMDLVFSSKSNRKWPKKWLKLKQSVKTPIGVVRRLRVNML